MCSERAGTPSADSIPTMHLGSVDRSGYHELKAPLAGNPLLIRAATAAKADQLGDLEQPTAGVVTHCRIIDELAANLPAGLTDSGDWLYRSAARDGCALIRRFARRTRLENAHESHAPRRSEAQLLRVRLRTDAVQLLDVREHFRHHCSRVSIAELHSGFFRQPVKQVQGSQ